MPPFDFPSPPTVGQIVIGPNNTQYQWDGTKWVTVVNAAAGGGVTISDTAPINPIIGRLWFDSVGLQTYIWYTDPTSSQWTPVINQGGLLTDAPSNGTLYGRMNGAWAAVPPVTGVYLPLTGGTLTGQLNITAPNVAQLNIAPTTGNLANITLSKPAGNTWASIIGENQGSMRWQMTLGDTTAESGSNAGSNFSIANYDDSGNQISGVPLTITRSNGGVALNGVGGVSLSPPSVSAVLNLNKGANSGQYNILRGSTVNSRRWELVLGDSTAETGSNAGSNFTINAFNDGGATALGQYMTINRANGNATFAAALNIGGWMTSAGVTSTSSINGVNNIQVNAPSGNTNITMDKTAAGGVNYLWGQTNNVGRWGIALGEGSAQTGGDAGDNFGIVALNDSGGWKDWAFYITRSSMLVQINHGLVVSNGVNISSGGLYSNGVITTGTFPGQGNLSAVIGYFISGSWWNCERLSINSGGTQMAGYYNSGGGVAYWTTTTSDRRKKSNLKPAGDALDIVNRIPVYDLDYNAGVKSTTREMPDSETERWPFSLVADEVADVLPHAGVRGMDEDRDFWVAYSPQHMVAVLWRAVQQLTEELDALKAKVGAA